MRVVANSVPKSGTHLLARLLVLLGLEQTRSGGGIRSNLVSGPYTPLKRLLRARGETVTIGVVYPQQVSRRWLARRLERVKEGEFVTAHCVHTPALAALFRAAGMRTVCILRDPRAVAVSQMHYIKRLKTHPVHDAFVRLPSDADRLMFTIRGGELGGRRMLSIDERYRRFSGWSSEPEAVMVRFEDLVGTPGGGSEAAQRAAVGLVAAHLGLAADEATLSRVGGSIFGAGQTSRKGTIGGWREEFAAEHERAAEEVAGPLLAELGYEPGRA